MLELVIMEKAFKRITENNLIEVAEVIKDLTKEIFEKKKRACVIFLNGDLGSGKTTFTKSFGKVLGIQEEIISPTFVLRKDYHNLIHIDGYRFEQGQEAKVLELFRELDKKELIIIIEWPERFVNEINLKPDIIVDFKIINNKERDIFLKMN